MNSADARAVPKSMTLARGRYGQSAMLLPDKWRVARGPSLVYAGRRSATILPPSITR